MFIAEEERPRTPEIQGQNASPLPFLRHPRGISAVGQPPSAHAVGQPPSALANASARTHAVGQSAIVAQCGGVRRRHPIAVGQSAVSPLWWASPPSAHTHALLGLKES